MKKKVTLLPVLFFLLSFASAAANADGDAGWRDGGVGHKLGCFIIKQFGYEACEK